MDSDALFIHTLEDLHRSVFSLDEYDVLRASRLIRQLLLDGGDSLAETVNRVHRKKIQYVIAELPPPTFPGLPIDNWCAIDGIDPLISPPKARRLILGKDKLLGVTVAVCGENRFSIHDIVDFVATMWRAAYTEGRQSVIRNSSRHFSSSFLA